MYKNIDITDKQYRRLLRLKTEQEVRNKVDEIVGVGDDDFFWSGDFLMNKMFLVAEIMMRKKAIKTIINKNTTT